MSPFTLNVFSLLLAIVLAAAGGEAFLRGVLGFSTWLRLPKMLVASTLAAFATSSPELTVSTMAALAGTPEIGLGDALGSNVVNIALIFGVALLFGAIPARREEIQRDMVFAVAVPVLTLILIKDGSLSRTDGFLLLTLFVAWLVLMIRQAISHRKNGAPNSPPTKVWQTALFALGGLACLIFAGKLFVSGASGIALAMGIHPYVIGATFVAFGTSLPELMTTLISRWRGHDEIGLGTILGSNLYNGLAIVGTASTICPINVIFRETAVALLLGILTVLLIVPRRGKISRRRGIVLLAIYAAYVIASLIAN